MKYIEDYLTLMKNSERKWHLIKAGFCISILIILSGCRNTMDKKVQADIDSITAKWVPDNREAICSVTAKTMAGGMMILFGETTIPQAGKEIIETLSKPGIVLIDSILILPDTIRNDKYLGLVSLSVINLRKQPDHRSELVSQAILGTPVLILKSENSWLLVQTPDRYIAWTESSSVKLMNRSDMSAWKQAERVICLENSAWVYTSPDETGVVGDLVSGSILKKAGEEQGYMRVILPDGREGFVRKKNTMEFDLWKNQVICAEESVGSVASAFLGLPYLWGGSSAKAVDCSGFVQSVYFMNGLILSRDASLQALHGLAVDHLNGYNQFKMGDLLFFGSKDNSRSNITHVAIYLGDGEYIHSSGRVMINSLDSARNNFNSHRKKTMLTAKRVIGAENDPGIIPVSKHPWY